MKYAAIAMILTCSACTSAGSLYHSAEYEKREPLRASLVKDERAILSEEAIQKLLASRIQLPTKGKLAVFPVAHTTAQAEAGGYGSYSAPVEFLQASQANLKTLEQALSTTGRFIEITHVPRLMAPAEISLTRAREAAALMQADGILLYEIRSQLVTYHGNLFTRNAVKVSVSMDIVLLDTRTGVVPYAETFETIHEAATEAEDYNMADLQRRAEIEGGRIVMRDAARSLVEFFRT